MKLGKADLHVHSNYSPDAFSSVRDVLEKAKNAQLDVVAITDHHTIEGAKEAEKLAADFGLEVVVGEEILTQEGEVIGLFLKETIPPDLPILEAIQRIKRQGGLVFAPHPLSFWQDGVGEKLLGQLAQQIDGAEVLSAGWTGRKNFAKMQRLNEEIFKLAAIGGSDAHFADLVGKAYTLFKGKTASELYSSIQNKTTAVEGNFWSKRDFFSYGAHWLKNNFRKGGPLIIFDILWTVRKAKKAFRRFSDQTKI
ncbi:MAG: PHP domain-containing protein [Candidatus Nealsonbacteria bacterium]|nr:PHP domain-containing protein [Candidatus Nealsonbacteria bacterium]